MRPLPATHVLHKRSRPPNFLAQLPLEAIAVQASTPVGFLCRDGYDKCKRERVIGCFERPLNLCLDP